MGTMVVTMLKEFELRLWTTKLEFELEEVVSLLQGPLWREDLASTLGDSIGNELGAYGAHRAF